MVNILDAKVVVKDLKSQELRVLPNTVVLAQDRETSNAQKVCLVGRQGHLIDISGRIFSDQGILSTLEVQILGLIFPGETLEDFQRVYEKIKD